MSIDNIPGLKSIAVSGSHYEVGLQLGRFGADITHRYLRCTPAWLALMARRDDSVLQEMRALTKARFPAYWQELQGLADGLGVPFDDVFLWNCRGDLWALGSDGCTTIQLPGERPIIAHNEDGDPSLRGHCAIARIEPVGGVGFRSFIYPASLPGHTCAVTDRGLIQTVNNIRPEGSGAGLPRMVLGRAVLDCEDLDTVIKMLRTAPRAGSFHFTLAQPGDRRVMSVEFTHRQCSVLEVQSPSCHANHLVHPQMSGEYQKITDSSRARQKRAGEMIAETGNGGPDALAILWDRTDPALPIYRTQPDDPDQENTLATAVFVLNGDAVDCTFHESDSHAPGIVCHIPARLT